MLSFAGIADGCYPVAMTPDEFARVMVRAAKASPAQQRFMANGNAYQAQKLARARLPVQFTLRNRWEERSIRVERATPRSPVSLLGSAEEGLARQELGGRQLFNTVPGAGSAGQAGSAKRKRPQKRALQIASIQNPVSVTSVPKKQRSAASIAVARKKRNEFAIVQMKSKTGKGLVRVFPKRIVFLHWFPTTRPSVKKSPWLTPASIEAMRSAGERWENNQKEYWLRKMAKK